jgi:hypothetical protein
MPSTGLKSSPDQYHEALKSMTADAEQAGATVIVATPSIIGEKPPLLTFDGVLRLDPGNSLIADELAKAIIIVRGKREPAKPKSLLDER